MKKKLQTMMLLLAMTVLLFTGCGGKATTLKMPTEGAKPKEQEIDVEHTQAAIDAIASETADGEYDNVTFDFFGGTGRTQITCDRVLVKDGVATAEIVFDSSNYDYVRIDETKYETTLQDGNAVVSIPVKLGEDMTVYADTTAMSKPHEIEYVLRVLVE